jgi:hypothetical protein
MTTHSVEENLDVFLLHASPGRNVATVLMGTILAASIRVMDAAYGRCSERQGLLQGIANEFFYHSVVDGPAYHRKNEPRPCRAARINDAKIQTAERLAISKVVH